MNRTILNRRPRGLAGIARVVAFLMTFGQAMPLAFASRYLRPEGTSEGRGAADLREDPAWLYGAAGADPLTMLGAQNLFAGGKEIASAAFNEDRAFVLAGPMAKPIAEQVARYAAGYKRRFPNSRALSEKELAALQARLEQAQQGLLHSGWRQVVYDLNHSASQPDIAIRFVVILDETGTPGLVNDGVMGTPTHHALVAYGGFHHYAGWNDAVPPAAPAMWGKPKSVYLSLPMIEGLLAQGQEGQTALRHKLNHEITDVIHGSHANEPPEIATSVNAAIEKVYDAYLRKTATSRAKLHEERQKAAIAAAKKLATRVQLVPYSMNLGRFFADGRVPDAVLTALRASLAQAKSDGKIVDVYLRRFAGELFLNVTYNGADRSPAVDRLVSSAVVDAIGSYRPPQEAATPDAQFTDRRARLTTMSYAQRIQELFAGRPMGTFSFNERQAEPVYFSIALGGHVSAYNRPIMKLLEESMGNQSKIEGLDEASLKKLSQDELLAKLAEEARAEGPGFTVVVERIADVLAGKQDRTAYAFVFPRSAPYIHALVDDQSSWVITKVLPRPGNKLYDPAKKPLEQEPFIQVLVDRVAPAPEESFNPVFVARQQSGSPAVGEFAAVTTPFYIATAGPNGTHHRGVVPVTLEEADAGTFNGDGRVQMVSFGYQSHDNGHIPPLGVQDMVALANDIRPIRDDQKWVHDALMLHGPFQPHVTGGAAIHKAEQAAKAFGARFHPIPIAVEVDAQGRPIMGPDQKPKTKLDPLLEPSNKTAVVTLSDLKADIGGDPGHMIPPALYFATLRASLKAAKQAGLIEGYEVQNAGDDMHLWIVHQHGVDSPVIHTLAWESFFRSGWVLKKIGYPQLKGYQPYGFMQDLVSPAVQRVIKEGKLEAYANLTDDFITALAEEIQAYPEEAVHMPNIRQAYEDYKTQKAEGTVLELPFSGNVRGQGIGFAEKALSADEIGQDWTVVMSDKTGPGAYNRRMYLATRIALEVIRSEVVSDNYQQAQNAVHRVLQRALPEAPSEARAAFTARIAGAWVSAFRTVSAFRAEDVERMSRRLAHGLVYEVWDVKANTRAFIDADTEDEHLLAMLSAVNDFNIKRIWTKSRSGWVGDLTEEELARLRAQAHAKATQLKEELAARKAELQALLSAKQKTDDQLTPWERLVVGSALDTVVGAAVDQELEMLKVREFLGDDYIASFSTEKLAVSGGGTYLGKDDPTSWIMEPLAKIFRAITLASPTVSLGDARGSHWVAIRPEDKDHSVAVAWSNSVENAFRFRIGVGGRVETDEHGRMKVEDLYVGEEWDRARETVARFNKIWIDTQAGFTPRGPGKDDVEAAYPYPATVRKLTAPNSPFGIPSTATTAQDVGRGRWAEQFAGMDHVVSPEVAALAVRPTSQLVVVHDSVLAQGPDAAMAIEDLQKQLGLVLGAGSNAVKVVLAVGGVSTPEQAQQRLTELTARVAGGSANTAVVNPEMFAQVVPAPDAGTPKGAFVGRVESVAPQSRVAAVIGPQEWAASVKNATDNPQNVAVVAINPTPQQGKATSAGAAILAGVEAAATSGRLNPTLAAKLDVLDEGGMLIAQELAVSADVEGDLQTYRNTTRAAAAVAESG